MVEIEKEEIVAAWIAHVCEIEKNKNAIDTIWASEKIWELNDSDPELCWEIILRILDSANDDPVVIANLSAGPLEDLLGKHGPQFIERVEISAKRNPKFASLLGGVWKSSMTDDVWARVQAVWNRSGWNGNSTG